MQKCVRNREKKEAQEEGKKAIRRVVHKIHRQSEEVNIMRINETHFIGINQ